jgi:HTH-type transcriptional regulator / antitoxin HigA
MRSNVATFRPKWSSAPGDTIADILRERAISLAEFASRIGESAERAEDLLRGRSTITIGLARKLEKALGGSVEFWMSRDFQYREDSARLDAADREWLSELPIGDMVKFGWLKPAPQPSEEVGACLRYFNVPSVDAWQEKYANVWQLAAFRTSRSFDSSPGAVAAWLRQGEILSQSIDCGAWDPTGFRKSLNAIRTLTRLKDPDRFVPLLQEFCAASGVAVTIVRPPAGCRASGATRFLTRSKANLLLSFRYLSDDQFWFTFFHEAGHLLLHGPERIFLEGVNAIETKEEQEANEFSAQIVVPPEYRSAMRTMTANYLRVISFARRAGVSPGLIVGQLQHEGRVKNNELNVLKRRFKWRVDR